MAEQEQITSEQLYEFKKRLRKLKECRGDGTQLVTVYVSAGYPINEVSSRVREEINQASNIKSKQTRTNVTDALERIVTVLKGFRKTPENGLVIFAGNVSTDPSKQDLQTFYFEPISKLGMNVYRCDSTFFIEPLERMMYSRDSYGVLAFEGRDATLAILQGTEFRIVDKIHNTAHAKVRKGGQSARRYERLIEESNEFYYKRVGEAMDQLFLNKVKGVLVGGPGPMKEYFLNEKTFNYQIKIIGVVDTGYIDEQGIREIIEKSGDLIKDQEAIKEKRLFDNFMKIVIKTEKAVYGLDQVMECINSKRAELVLVSEDAPFSVVHFKCPSCDSELSKIYRKGQEEKSIKCEKCGSTMNSIDIAPIAEYVIDLCRKLNIKVEILSATSAPGEQFLNGFGGIGALLKY
jgi:peptide chain release factor subunit 1